MSIVSTERRIERQRKWAECVSIKVTTNFLRPFERRGALFDFILFFDVFVWISCFCLLSPNSHTHSHTEFVEKRTKTSRWRNIVTSNIAVFWSSFLVSALVITPMNFAFVFFYSFFIRIVVGYFSISSSFWAWRTVRRPQPHVCYVYLYPSIAARILWYLSIVDESTCIHVLWICFGL